MNISILGVGAIGSLWACYLHNAGHNISLWSRDTAPSISLSFAQQAPIQFRANQISDMNNADLVIVAVKAWQVEQALLPIIPHLKKGCCVLFTHNGMGAVDPLLAQFSEHPVLFATTTHGALIDNQSKIQHTGQGQTIVGALNERGALLSSQIVPMLDHALAPVSWDDNIQQALWNKLAINCCINPLTAIHNCRNGELAQSETLALIQALCVEISEVMTAEGLTCDSDALFAKSQQVIQATSENFSSMHQDIQHQRRTEIDYITGYLLQRAKAQQILTPYNQTLYQQIKQKEAQQ
ncbi:2-dehydropantoate 2-reductase [Vibrio halioticoli NBRC 102217]|uniref:2-dehydropantoate 2-reductase n=1 Tax=Vibrio halioticoli NBRC 102217 TaxID=1219072 RepID=V5FGF3_9VIBR|nr:2-dehydropantoate 2-reductase [Vibrio halioticoli]GAD90828.1 2-dehydropantoate 2-reductase [Vibrio halioticoli NBRC 102217]